MKRSSVLSIPIVFSALTEVANCIVLWRKGSPTKIFPGHGGATTVGAELAPHGTFSRAR